MSYCTSNDIMDTLLKVQESDMKEAADYVDSLARSLGVSRIITPTPYEVKQLAISYACMIRAKYLAGKAPKGDSEDAYERKRRTYAADVQYWEGKITAALLSGNARERRKFPPVIAMYRG